MLACWHVYEGWGGCERWDKTVAARRCGDKKLMAMRSCVGKKRRETAITDGFVRNKMFLEGASITLLVGVLL